MLWNKFRIWSFINKLLNRFFSFLYFTNVKFRLFEARSCWVFPEESFLECIIFLVRSVRIWITFFLLKWKYFAFNPIWSEYFKTTKDSCNPEIGKHNDPGQGRLVCMHPHIPNKVPKRTDNQRSLEHNENLLDEFSPKINRTWIPLEKVILIYPILKKEDDDEYRSCCRGEKSIERNDEGEDDIECVHGCKVEFWVLQNLV